MEAQLEPRLAAGLEVATRLGRIERPALEEDVRRLGELRGLRKNVAHEELEVRIGALVDAGAAVALATDLNPGSAFCESLPLVCSLAATQLKLAPEEALSACTVNAAHVLGRADRKGRLAAGYDADVVLVASDDWRHLAYHLGGPVVHTVITGGQIAWRRSA